MVYLSRNMYRNIRYTILWLNLREDGLFKPKHVQEYTLYNTATFVQEYTLYNIATYIFRQQNTVSCNLYNKYSISRFYCNQNVHSPHILSRQLSHELTLLISCSN